MKPLSASEQEIMDAMWELDQEWTCQELYDYLVKTRNITWVFGTVNGFLQRMDKKGVFVTRRAGKVKYYKPITKGEYNRKLINNSLYENYGYEFDKLLINFTKDEDNKELLAKARELLNLLNEDD